MKEHSSDQALERGCVPLQLCCLVLALSPFTRRAGDLAASRALCSTSGIPDSSPSSWYLLVTPSALVTPSMVPHGDCHLHRAKVTLRSWW